MAHTKIAQEPNFCWRCAAEDVDIPLDFKNWIGSLSAGTDVHEIVFRETDGAYDLDWHTAPCRQFIIMTNVRPDAA